MTNLETPVSGGGARKGARDGVSGAPDGANTQGRTAGGESGGGGYRNPHGGDGGSNSGFFGHGGQTDMAYHGGGQAGRGDAPNAATGSDSSDGSERDRAAWTAPHYPPHTVHAGGRTFGVVETNGVAEAEAAGKVGTAAPYERAQHAPGSG